MKDRKRPQKIEMPRLFPLISKMFLPILKMLLFKNSLAQPELIRELTTHFGFCRKKCSGGIHSLHGILTSRARCTRNREDIHSVLTRDTSATFYALLAGALAVARDRLRIMKTRRSKKRERSLAPTKYLQTCGK